MNRRPFIRHTALGIGLLAGCLSSQPSTSDTTKSPDPTATTTLGTSAAESGASTTLNAVEQIKPLEAVKIDQPLGSITFTGGGTTKTITGIDSIAVVKYDIGAALDGPALFTMSESKTGEEVFSRSMSGDIHGSIFTVIGAKEYEFTLETYGNNEVEWTVSLSTIATGEQFGLPIRVKSSHERVIGPVSTDGNVIVTLTASKDADTGAGVTFYAEDGGILGGFETKAGKTKSKDIPQKGLLFVSVNGPKWNLSLEQSVQ